MEQWYANNTTIKFPLDPFHEGDVPDDMLVDMSVTVPPGTDVWLTNFIVTDRFVFLSLEATDGSAVGHCIQTDPDISHIVPLEMKTAGYGWIVFGPGIKEGPREYKDIRIKLDASVLLPDVPVTDPYELYVDGKSYPRPEILNIKTLDYITVNENKFDDALWFIRDDSKLSGNMAITLFTEETYYPNYVTDINGLTPDSAGNININITPVGTPPDDNTITEIKRKSDDTIIGLLLRAYNVDGCSDETERLKEKLKCHTEYGVPAGLPLDFVNCDEDPCPPFSVYYLGNTETSGTAPVDSNIYDTGDDATILNEDDLEKSGYTFEGWNTEPDASGTNYSVGQIVNMTGNLILYARWSII